MALNVELEAQPTVKLEAWGGRNPPGRSRHWRIDLSGRRPSRAAILNRPSDELSPLRILIRLVDRFPEIRFEFLFQPCFIHFREAVLD